MANTNLAELNALATKITGQTVAENSIVAALNKIASYYKGSSVAEISNAAALAEIEDNYSAGGGADIQANKAVTITTNTVTEVTPDDGKDGMAKVTVTTNIPQTSQLYTWYYLGGVPDSDDYVGVIAFFADADMTQQVTLESYGLEVDTSNFTIFKALLIVAEGGLDFAIKYNVNDASNFGQAIQVPRRISLGRENDGDYYVTFCTEPSEDGHDMYYYLGADSTVQKSLAWALSEYRTADESQS